MQMGGGGGTMQSRPRMTLHTQHTRLTQDAAHATRRA